MKRKVEKPKTEERTKLNKKAVEEVLALLVKIKNKETAKEFLTDILSSSETKDIARRILAAKLLYQGKTYQEIEDLLGMGPLTINKIHFKTKGSQVLRKLLS